MNDIKSFSEYFVEKVNKANLSNALSILSKFDLEGDSDKFKLEEFFDQTLAYIDTKVKKNEATDLDVQKAYIISKYYTKLKNKVGTTFEEYSDKNKLFQACIIDVWSLYNGVK